MGAYQADLADDLRKALGEVALDLDGASPAEKITALIEQLPALETSLRCVLSALAALEAAFSARFGYRGVYVMQAPSLRFLCDDQYDERMPFAVLALQGAQLIYRFTVARRFDVADSTMKQIRINSWGHHVLPEMALPEVARATRARLQDYFGREPGRMARTVELLRQTLTAERAKELSMLNANQPVVFLQ